MTHSSLAITSPLHRFRHIAIEGPIGVGKSTLARKLAAHLGADVMLEQALENPFLDRFYQDMPGYAFQTQLAFLFQRVKQMQTTLQLGMFANAVISDFLFEKDAIFARLNLSDDEFRMYSRLYEQVASQMRAPDLVIWLQASPSALLHRIHRRAIPMEQGITSSYLQGLCDAYVVYFHAYDGAPVFAFGTEHFNPIDVDDDFATLLERLANFHGRREFFHSHVEIPFS